MSYIEMKRPWVYMWKQIYISCQMCSIFFLTSKILLWKTIKLIIYWMLIIKEIICLVYVWCLLILTLALQVLSHFSHVRLFMTPWTVAPRLLCPWDSPGKNIGGDAISFSRKSSQPRNWTCTYFCLLHWQASSSPLAPPVMELLLSSFNPLK